MRINGLTERIQKEHWAVNDCGDIPCPELDDTDHHRPVIRAEGEPAIKCADIVSKVNKETAEKTYERAKAGDFVLTIGGDHAIAIGSLAGIIKARPDTGIIWVDAHADINTPYTSGSGNIHGMVLSFLMKHKECEFVTEYDWLKEYPTLDPSRIVYIGLRDLDLGEKRIIRNLGIRAFTMHDVDKYGIGAVMEKSIEHLRRRKDCPLHLSFDIDGVDPMFAPSTGTRVGGGLTKREAYFICESVAETGLLSSMDIVEVNSALGERDDAKTTVELAKSLVVAALGDAIL
jgi:arginase